MRLLISGGRHFSDAAAVLNELNTINVSYPIRVLMHGDMSSLSNSAESWASQNNVHIVRYPANWSCGKHLQAERDHFMLRDGQPDAILAFPGGKHQDDLLRDAKKLGITIVLASVDHRGIRLRLKTDQSDNSRNIDLVKDYRAAKAYLGRRVTDTSRSQ